MIRIVLVGVCAMAAGLTIAAGALAEVEPISPWKGPGYADFCDVPIDGVALQGDEADDAIIGTELSDLLLGGAGTDTLRGEDASNCLFGQLGRDEIRGGDGEDQIWGNPGKDRIRGGAGNDVIHAGPGRDKVNGGSGHDGVVGQGGGVDNINCGPGFDRAIVDRKDKPSGNCERLFVVVP